MQIVLKSICALIFLAGSAIARDLGSDPQAVILTLEMRGGQKPRVSDGPVLRIAADGTMTLRAAKPGDPPVISNLTEDELERLLAQLVKQLDVLSITDAAIEAEIAAGGKRRGTVLDAPTTVLSIALPEGSTSVSVNGVSALARAISPSPTLDRLYDVQRILLDLAERRLMANG